MAIYIYWRIPTHGDKGALRHQLTRGDWAPTKPGSIAPGLRGGEPDDFSYLDHMADIARAAEISGFYGALIPPFPIPKTHGSSRPLWPERPRHSVS